MKVNPLQRVRVLIAALTGLLLVPIPTLAIASDTSVDLGPTYTVAMTAYNATAAQTDGTPDITASGAFSDPDVVAARSKDLASELPFGTVIEIQAATSSSACGYSKVGQDIGLRVIADAMNPKMKNKIDVLLPSQETTSSGKTVNPAIILGVCKDVTIQVVGHVDIADMPTTQSELAAAVESSSALAVAK